MNQYVFEPVKPVTETKYGRLRGVTYGDINIFMGIPYAHADRFCMPVEPDSWEGIRNAYTYGPISPQTFRHDPPSYYRGLHMLQKEGENCQNLNIWAPRTLNGEKKPVFVWIHGGGYFAGNAMEEYSFDGFNLSHYGDVVFVSVNHRLNLLGFLDLSEYGERFSNSVNAGIMDIVMALKWIHENIAAFGGDPDRITVAGQSGGAVAVGALHASPLMKGLIQRVSIESGPIFWGFMKPAARQELEEKGQRFLEAIGCTGIEELRKRDAWELFDAYREICQDPMYFTYCIDGEFLPEPYEKMLEGGNFNDFDVMIGSCAQEILPGGEEGIPTDLYEEAVARLFPDAVDRMKEWYPAKDAKEARKQWSTIASDLMLMGSVRLAELCRRSGHKAYVWLMNKENETQKGRRTGSPHCAEMPYVFGRVDKGERNPFLDYHWVGKDYDFMELIQNYWYHFSESGDPNSPGAPEWNPYERDFDVCILGNDSHMMTDREREKYAYYYGRLMSGEVFPVKEMMMRGLDCGDAKKAEA